jgi:hypothetical protein
MNQGIELTSTEKKEVLLELSHWHNMPEIVGRIKYYAKNAQAS